MIDIFFLIIACLVLCYILYILIIYFFYFPIRIARYSDGKYYLVTLCFFRPFKWYRGINVDYRTSYQIKRGLEYDNPDFYVSFNNYDNIVNYYNLLTQNIRKSEKPKMEKIFKPPFFPENEITNTGEFPEEIGDLPF